MTKTFTENEYELAVSGVSLTLAALRVNEKVCLAYTQAVGLMIIHELVQRGEYELLIPELEAVEEPRGFATAIGILYPLLRDQKMRDLLKIITVHRFETDNLIKRTDLKPEAEKVTIH